jgi:hypothetical protein
VSNTGADAARELAARLTETPTDPRRISDLLDSLEHERRVAAIRSLGRRAQRRLYAAVDAFREVALGDLVPEGVADMVSVRHFGKNTLPAFTHFEKRFSRPTGVDARKPGRLYGFNFQSLAPLTGPGYFVATEDPNRREVVIDYTQLPEAHPDGWPEIRPNDQGLSRFVYGYMIDTLRRVSEHVTIGSAARKGKDLGSWFVLCREP